MSAAGKKIWLIGASEGIGEALARALAKDGAEMAISARSQEKIERIAGSLGAKHFALPLDVTNLESVQNAWGKLAERWGKPDIVIYNAGTYEPMSAREFNLRQAEHMVDVNFSGALRVLASVLPPFVAANQGHIVLVGSVAAYSGLARAIGYGASKAAILHLAENLRADFVNTHIKVQVVSPGFVKTRLTAKNDFPMPFLITPEVAAKAIVRGMNSNSFDINFPKRFTYILKFLRLLPYGIYFRLIGKVM